MIVLDNISKFYRDLCVIKDFSLTIEKGSFVGIMGRSGSGKSTLLNIIGLLDFCSKGKLFFNGFDVSKLTSSQLAEIRNNNIGFIFQQYNLIPNLSVKENIVLPFLYDTTKKYSKDELYQVCDFLDLLPLINKKVDFLSGGEKQRVAIARAIIKKADVILADEPTGNLDKENKDNIFDLLLQINQSNKTVVLVTHDHSLFEKIPVKIFLKD